MISKEWLSNYHTRDLQDYKNFMNNFMKPKLANKIKYPPENRFRKLTKPYAFVGGYNIWPQIPLYGSTFVSIPPWPEELLKTRFGWGTKRDIEDLIRLARLGKIQFVLNASALDYENCDHLEPILREFEPPFLYSPRIVDVDEGDDKKYYHEFLETAQSNFIPFLKEIYQNRPQRFIEKRIDDYAFDYVTLRKIGHDEIADEILQSLHGPPLITNAYCTVFGNLITVPMLNPLISGYNATFTDNMEDYEPFLDILNPQRINDVKDEIEKVILPGEVGRFTMKKTTYMPESYEACLALMDRYKQEDLHQLIESLQEGFRDNNIDIISKRSQGISEIFDNLWKDSERIKKLAKGINYGFSITLGAIGAIATASIGIGALTGIGFLVADKNIPFISEKLSRFFSQNYMVMISDFKHKYNVE